MNKVFGVLFLGLFLSAPYAGASGEGGESEPKKPLFSQPNDINRLVMSFASDEDLKNIKVNKDLLKAAQWEQNKRDVDVLNTSKETLKGIHGRWEPEVLAPQERPVVALSSKYAAYQLKPGKKATRAEAEKLEMIWKTAADICRTVYGKKYVSYLITESSETDVLKFNKFSKVFYQEQDPLRQPYVYKKGLGFLSNQITETVGSSPEGLVALIGLGPGAGLIGVPIAGAQYGYEHGGYAGAVAGAVAGLAVGPAVGAGLVTAGAISLASMPFLGIAEIAVAVSGSEVSFSQMRRTEYLDIVRRKQKGIEPVPHQVFSKLVCTDNPFESQSTLASVNDPRASNQTYKNLLRELGLAPRSESAGSAHAGSAR